MITRALAIRDGKAKTVILVRTVKSKRNQIYIVINRIELSNNLKYVKGHTDFHITFLYSRYR